MPSPVERTCYRCGKPAADDRRWVAEDLCSACTPIVLPDPPTPAMLEVLGLPNFRTGPVAHLYREAGHTIARKCEAEQAFVLHRFLALAVLHGAAWHEHASRDIDRHLALANARRTPASPSRPETA